MGGFVSRSAAAPALRKITAGNDAVTKLRLLDARRQLVLGAARQPHLMRLFDKKLSYLGTVTSERSGEYERLLDDSGVGTISLRWSDWLADLCAHQTRIQEDLHLIIDPNPNQRSWRTRMGYKVTSVRAVKHDDGTRTVELDIISLREHAKHILLGATPFSPPEFQPLKAWVWFQNLRSNLALATFINLARAYWPPLSLPVSLFDPPHWLTTRAGNLSPLHWPVQVQFVNPITDTSRTLPLAAKWQDLHSISEPLMNDAGVCLLDYVWLPEDKDSPHPELAALVGEQLARPTRACVVLAFEDRSGISGPTGTAVDGALAMVGKMLDDTITETIIPSEVIDADGGRPVFRKLLGVAATPPSLVWRDCEYSGLITSEYKMKRPGARTIWTGGQSPTWLNQVQTFLIRYALSQISEVIMYAAPGGLAGYQGAVSAPGSPGLENVYQNQFDNMLFAYAKYTSPAIALRLNEYGWLEDFEQGNGYAYVIAAALTLRQGMWKNAARASFTMTARDGEPWCYGYDYTIGDRGLFDVDGIYYTEQIRGGRWSYDETRPIDVTLTIGRNRDRDPFDAALKALSDGWNAIGSLVGGAAIAT